MQKYINQSCNYDKLRKRDLLYSEILIENNLNTEAISSLSVSIDTSLENWELTRKASLFLQLEVYDRVIEIYDILKEKGYESNDNYDLATALENKGYYAKSRDLYVMDTANYYEKNSRYLKLFLHDLKYQNGNLAYESYTSFRDLGYNFDPLALYRLKLFFKSPLQPIKIRDAGAILVLLIILFTIVLIPCMWLFPVYIIGHKVRGLDENNIFKWGMKNFWVISIGYLLGSFIGMMAMPETINSWFHYESLIEYFDPKNEGLAILLFIIVFGISIFINVNKASFQYLWKSSLNYRQVMGMAIGAFFLFKLFSILYVKIFNVSLIDDSTISSMLSLADFKPLIDNYGKVFGFIIIGLIGPIYEEIAFRGVILTVCKRYIGFHWANILQATLFASIHGSLMLLPLFIFFGLMVGVMVRRSKSLLPGIIFHVINNIIAFWAMTYIW